MTSSVEIPTLPIARVRALALVANVNPSYDDLAEVVDADPALTIALLRAANSAASAPVDRVRTAHIAMVRVGMKEARRIIMGVALSTSFQRLHCSGIDEDEMWRHLIATAVLADAIAWGEVLHSEAFTAGLLHDVGRLALAAADPARYSQVVKLAQRGVPAGEANGPSSAWTTSNGVRRLPIRGGSPTRLSRRSRITILARSRGSPGWSPAPARCRAASASATGWSVRCRSTRTARRR